MAFNWEQDLVKVGQRLDRAIEDGDVQKQIELGEEIRQIEDIIQARNMKKQSSDDEEQEALMKEMNEHNFGYRESEGEIVGEEDRE
jgi:hypothetical protein